MYIECEKSTCSLVQFCDPTSLALAMWVRLRGFSSGSRKRGTLIPSGSPLMLGQSLFKRQLRSRSFHLPSSVSHVDLPEHLSYLMTSAPFYFVTVSAGVSGLVWSELVIA